jgi:hypothetical protein
MRRARAAFGVALAFTLGGCGAVPHSVDDLPGKKAVTSARASSVVAEYNQARAEAMAQADVGRLQEVAGGAALAIDGRQPAAAAWAEPSQVIAGEFDSYPMWFVAISDVPDEHARVAAVFSRESSVDPWLLVDAPRLAETTEIPEVQSSDGVAEVHDGTAPMPGGLSGNELATRYAALLSDPSSPYAGEFAEDSFIAQMRDYAEAQPAGVGFDQVWRAASVSHVVELADGGALVFADLVRTETYELGPGKSLRFDGSEAERFLPEPIHDNATLTYYHQVLLLAPADDKPLAIGQYGALVSATGS